VPSSQGRHPGSAISASRPAACAAPDRARPRCTTSGTVASARRPEPAGL